ncbi:phosphoribosylglycinamide formyltransferase [Flavobacterium sp.]|uniref:phosphoribosylglycinamide formyltransferase n=1 Tax=Flavobacterium sp. TaxID=239 RepID=UPI002634FD13|nr:phosphoribosylglycinamide formyltransferase [Flavobacterium sp.]MDG2433505.1 phosphoribosylglycinamide formyltransferase [Flavobacterium sp.]
MKKIVVFASGSGTNAENIIKYFTERRTATVVMVLTNNPLALAIEKAEKLGVETVIFSKSELIEGKILQIINGIQPDLIVLAGFLLKFPQVIIQAYPNKVINIHPALLPKYGGKGMYGMHVHQAVVANKEKETGITVHYVNEQYDEGAIIAQKKVVVLGTDTAEVVAAKIHDLEQRFFPEIVASLV